MYEIEQYSKIVTLPAEKVARAIDGAVMHTIIEQSSFRDVLLAINNGGYTREVFCYDFMVSCKKLCKSNDSFLIKVLREKDEKNAKDFVNQLEARL